MKGLFVNAKKAIKRNIRDLREVIRDARAERTKKTYTSTREYEPPKQIRRRTRAEHDLRRAQRKFPNQARGRWALKHANLWK